MSKSRDIQTRFYGYNHNLVNGDYEFFDMKNLTGDFVPLMSPRSRRAQLDAQLIKPQGLLAKEQLAWVDDSKLYYGGVFVHDLKQLDKERQLVSMGAKIIIFPDKASYNTATGDFEWLERKFETQHVDFTLCNLAGDTITPTESASEPEGPKNGDFWIDSSGDEDVLKVYSSYTQEWSSVATTYIKVKAAGINNGLSLYDVVQIGGLATASERTEEEYAASVSHIDGYYPIWGIGQDYIIITELIKKSGSLTIPDGSAGITFERTVPELDYVVESENRLWGCIWDGEINEIYACAQGDPKNWHQFIGTTQDSYTLSVGSDGRFTGAAVHNGYVLFFKENVIHKIYGSKPSNYQITNVTCRGILRNSSKSACIANETLYYLSKSGVCQYAGGTPSGIYAPFGKVRYKDGVGGACGDRYYISMKDVQGRYHLFVYDEALNMWFREDNLEVQFFAEDKGNLYYIDAENKLCVMDCEQYDGAIPIKKKEEAFEWYGESGDIGIAEPDGKWYSEIQIRLKIEAETKVYISLQYNSDGQWVQVAAIENQPKGAYTIPITTPKVDHMKIRISGEGAAKIYSISKYYEKGSYRNGN